MAKPVGTKRLIIANKVRLETQTHTFARSLALVRRQTGGDVNPPRISEEASAHYWRGDGSAVYMYVFMEEYKQC